MPVVSVIIPVYKVGPYIERCIRSVLAQTFRDMEVILVDDASPDDSMTRARALMSVQQDIPWQVITHEKNRGLAAARNSGLAVASGRFFYFPDSDDFLEPELLETTCGTIGDADMLTFGSRSVYEDARLPSYEELPLPAGRVEGPSALLSLLKGECRAYICMQLFRRELFDTIRFPEGKVYEDRLTLPYLYLQSAQVVFLRKVLYNYLQRGGSISRTFQPGMVDTLEPIRRLRTMLDGRFNEPSWRQALLTFDYNNIQSFVFTTSLRATSYRQVRAIWMEGRRYIRTADLLRCWEISRKMSAVLMLFKISPGLFWLGPRKYLTWKMDESRQGH